MDRTDLAEVLLSVCIIGRNEATSVPQLAESLQPLRELPFGVETVFVDSASTDDTVSVARTHFDRVYVLEDSANLSASAGRYIATLKAEGEWLLFLDADMRLCDEFVAVIRETVVEHNLHEGVVGEYTNIYSSGAIRPNVLRHRRECGVVDQFGGAVLLPREAVLNAGNWNPRVFSNEEIDLYTRLRSTDCVVRFVNKPMVLHYTEEISRWRMLLNCFVPMRGGFGKKYYGIGQVLASRVQERTLIGLVRYFPYPFIYWACLLLAVGFVAVGWMAAGVVVFVAATLYIYKQKGINFIALYVAFAIQAALGWRHYDRTYDPAIRESHAVESNHKGVLNCSNITAQ